MAIFSKILYYGPMVKRSRHRPFTAVTRVRFPDGSPDEKHAFGRAFCFACFSEMTTPGLLGRVKSFRFQHRAKREEMNNFTIARKIILYKRRPFTGRRASDAGGVFSAPLERLAGSMPIQGLRRPPGFAGEPDFAKRQSLVVPWRVKRLSLSVPCEAGWYTIPKRCST